MSSSPGSSASCAAPRSGHPQIILDGGDVEVDLATRRLSTPRATHQLTPTEARLLQVLAASVDRVIPTEELLYRVWTDADGADPSYLWVTVRRLRRKLEADPDRPRYLITERGVGYRLSSGTAAPRPGVDRAPHRALAARLRRPPAGDPAADRAARRRGSADGGPLRRRERHGRGGRRVPRRPRLGGDARPRLHRRPRRRGALVPVTRRARGGPRRPRHRRRLPADGRLARRAQPPARHPRARGERRPDRRRAASRRRRARVRGADGHARPDVALRGDDVRDPRPAAAGRLPRDRRRASPTSRSASSSAGHRSPAPSARRGTSRGRGVPSPSPTWRSAIGWGRSSMPPGRAGWIRRRRRSPC